MSLKKIRVNSIFSNRGHSLTALVIMNDLIFFFLNFALNFDKTSCTFWTYKLCGPPKKKNFYWIVGCCTMYHHVYIFFSPSSLPSSGQQLHTRTHTLRGILFIYTLPIHVKTRIVLLFRRSFVCTSFSDIETHPTHEQSAIPVGTEVIKYEKRAGRARACVRTEHENSGKSYTYKIV